MMRYVKMVTVVMMVMAVALVAPGCGVQESVLDRLDKEAWHAYDAANYPRALEKWEAGLTRAQALNNKHYSGRFLGKLGIVYENLGQYQVALEYYEQALAIHHELGNRWGGREYPG